MLEKQEKLPRMRLCQKEGLGRPRIGGWRESQFLHRDLVLEKGRRVVWARLGWGRPRLGWAQSKSEGRPRQELRTGLGKERHEKEIHRTGC